MRSRRILKTRSFRRWADGAGVADEALAAAVGDTDRGRRCVDLGGGVHKLRLAVAGRGRRGGARVLLATNRGDRWIFIFGFLKNERDNVSQRELAAWKALASDLLGLSEEQLDEHTKTGALEEIAR